MSGQVEVSAIMESPQISNSNIVLPDDTLSCSNQRKCARLSWGNIDQFERFQVTEEDEEVPDILAYWAARFTNPCWSQLAHMALEIYSIAAMSAEVERAFSRYMIISFVN